MPKYLFTYHGGSAPQSQEEGAKVMEAWNNWFNGLGSAVVDMGNPTGASGTVGSDGSTSAGGGANPVTGYSLINADNLDAALEIARGCPQLAANGTIEVSETVDVM